MPFSVLDVALGIAVLATVNEADFVVPPAQVAPVGLQVLFELAVHLGILTYAEHDTVTRNAGLLRRPLVPVGLLVVEGAH